MCLRESSTQKCFSQPSEKGRGGGGGEEWGWVWGRLDPVRDQTMTTTSTTSTMAVKVRAVSPAWEEFQLLDFREPRTSRPPTIPHTPIFLL